LTQFSQLGLAAPIARAVNAKGYVTPTPIQVEAIPHILAGHDLLGIAATGTGKTAAFALPILHRLLATPAKAEPGSCRALILSPTRELAAQIAESFVAYGASTGLTTVAIYGGVSMDKQLKALRRGADILVACPGRLLDHVERGTVRLDRASVLVLDEADHMLDLGFIPSVRRIIRALPKVRQTLFFSATMPPPIRKLADEMLKAPKTVSVSPSATPPERINQSVLFVDGNAKRRRLAELLRERPNNSRALVFTRTKRGADKVVKDLCTAGIDCAAIHGNKSQGQRERTLDAFKSGRAPVLIATDIAARGIDVSGIELVVNFDLPHVPETYIHRIGRTARAGAGGIAIALCAPDERPLLKAIERMLGGPISARGEPERREAFAGTREPQRAAAIAHRPVARPHRQETARRDHHRAKPRRTNVANPDGAGPTIAEVGFMNARTPPTPGEAYLRRPAQTEQRAPKRSVDIA
jgi:ATP-dependent RNA helicase RhlE